MESKLLGYREGKQNLKASSTSPRQKASSALKHDSRAISSNSARRQGSKKTTSSQKLAFKDTKSRLTVRQQIRELKGVLTQAAANGGLKLEGLLSRCHCRSLMEYLFEEAVAGRPEAFEALGKVMTNSAMHIKSEAEKGHKVDDLIAPEYLMISISQLRTDGKSCALKKNGQTLLGCLVELACKDSSKLSYLVPLLDHGLPLYVADEDGRSPLACTLDLKYKNQHVKHVFALIFQEYKCNPQVRCLKQDNGLGDSFQDCLTEVMMYGINVSRASILLDCCQNFDWITMQKIFAEKIERLPYMFSYKINAQDIGGKIAECTKIDYCECSGCIHRTVRRRKIEKRQEIIGEISRMFQQVRDEKVKQIFFLQLSKRKTEDPTNRQGVSKLGPQTMLEVLKYL